jgi:hypothetical protein
MSEAEAEAARLIRVVPNGDGWNVEHVDGAVEALRESRADALLAAQEVARRDGSAVLVMGQPDSAKSPAGP